MQVTDLAMQRMMRRYITAYMETRNYQAARDKSLGQGHRENAEYQRGRKEESMGAYTAILECLEDITGLTTLRIDARMRSIVGDDNRVERSYEYAGKLLDALGLFTEV